MRNQSIDFNSGRSQCLKLITIFSCEDVVIETYKEQRTSKVATIQRTSNHIKLVSVATACRNRKAHNISGLPRIKTKKIMASHKCIVKSSHSIEQVKLEITEMLIATLR